MNRIRQIKRIKRIGGLTWFTLLVLSLLVFVFALLSGSEDGGILKNSPNSLPWLLLILVTLYAGKRPVLGGLLVLLLGLGLVYFFNFRSANFFLTTFILTMSIPLLGFVILFCGYYIDNVLDTTKKTQ